MASELTPEDRHRIEQFLRVPSGRRAAHLLAPEHDDRRAALAGDR